MVKLPRILALGLAITVVNTCAVVNLQKVISKENTGGDKRDGSVMPWGTYRGNLQRTGTSDDKAGPKQPKVLWVYKSKEHYVASPVPAGDRLFVSGLGAFNVASFTCLNTDPAAKERVLWNKSAPYLKLPVVSAPALTPWGLVFGDGMHQTDGATLHCLLRDNGMPVWQFPVPGRLVHLEGAPTILGDRVFLGGGAAGVFCVELNRASVDGKAVEYRQLIDLISRRWKELQAAYAKEKNGNEFAVPPSEDQLPRAVPKELWRQGENKWHVDAPVAAVGSDVLVGSSFLDTEKVGDRALFRLNGSNGEILWRTKLDFNPWGGPSVQGKIAVVAGSTIGYDTNALKGAKGEILAVDVVDGQVKWRKPVKGGIVSTVALTADAAIASATDGKVRSWDLSDGSPRWMYDAKSPLFAPPAVAGGVVYVADLQGVVHALDGDTGAVKWTIDLGTHPEVQSPGMVYGGPVVQGGRVYVATCNLEGANARQGTVVVCLGEK